MVNKHCLFILHTNIFTNVPFFSLLLIDSTILSTSNWVMSPTYFTLTFNYSSFSPPTPHFVNPQLLAHLYLFPPYLFLRKIYTSKVGDITFLYFPCELLNGWSFHPLNIIYIFLFNVLNINILLIIDLLKILNLMLNSLTSISESRQTFMFK